MIFYAVFNSLRNLEIPDVIDSAISWFLLNLIDSREESRLLLPKTHVNQ